MSSLIEQVLISLTFGFGLLTFVLGMTLFFQIFIKRVTFNSQTLMVFIASTLFFIGSSVLFFIFA